MIPRENDVYGYRMGRIEEGIKNNYSKGRYTFMAMFCDKLGKDSMIAIAAELTAKGYTVTCKDSDEEFTISISWNVQEQKGEDNAV